MKIIDFNCSNLIFCTKIIEKIATKDNKNNSIISVKPYTNLPGAGINKAKYAVR